MHGWSHIALTLMLGAGCARSERPYEPARTCAGLLAQAAACGLDPSPGPDVLAHCRRHRVDFEPLLECGPVSECGAFVACLQQNRERLDPGRRQRRLEGTRRRIEEATSSEHWAALERQCEVLAKDLDPGDLSAMCADIDRRAVQSYRAQLLAVRDDPAAPDRTAACAPLLEYAARMSTRDVTAAKRLCREARLALEARDVQRQAHRRAADADPRVPASCTPLLDRLQAVDTRAMRRAWVAVSEACWITLGRVVLERAGTSCTPEVGRVLDAFERHRLEAPDLGGLLASARSACRR